MNEKAEKLRIVRIDETDFGCEGRPDGMPVMDKIYLRDVSGEECVIQMEELLVWQRGLDEGMLVCFDENGQLQRLEETETQGGNGMEECE